MINERRIILAAIFIMLFLKIVLVIQLSPSRLIFQRVDNSYNVVDIRGNPREITIPAYHNELPVREIGVRAFSSQRRLEVVKFQDGSNIQIIRRLAFSNNPNLSTIYFPDSLTHLEQNVFNNSPNLTIVNISNNSRLQHIGASAFFQTNLTEIFLPTSLQSIGSLAFFNNRNLNIRVQSRNTEIFIHNDAFRGTPYCSYYFPDKLDELINNAIINI